MLSKEKTHACTLKGLLALGQGQISCISDDVIRAIQPSKPWDQSCCASATNTSSVRLALAGKDCPLGLGLQQGWLFWELLKRIILILHFENLRCILLSLFSVLRSRTWQHFSVSQHFERPSRRLSHASSTHKLSVCPITPQNWRHPHTRHQHNNRAGTAHVPAIQAPVAWKKKKNKTCQGRWSTASLHVRSWGLLPLSTPHKQPC